MPVIHKSTIRRARQSEKRQERNRGTLSAVKGLVKKLQTAIAEKKSRGRQGFITRSDVSTEQGGDEGRAQGKHGVSSHFPSHASRQFFDRLPLVIVRTFDNGLIRATSLEREAFSGEERCSV